MRWANKRVHQRADVRLDWRHVFWLEAPAATRRQMVQSCGCALNPLPLLTQCGKVSLAVGDGQYSMQTLHILM